MSKQRVFRLQDRTTFENLQLLEEDIPSVTKYEVLIRVRSVALNYRDLAIATSQYPFPVKDSVVPCSDAAGDVVQVGDCVSRVSAGDKVIGNFDITNLFGPQRDWNNGQGGPIDGVLRDYIVLPESAVVKVSKDAPLSYSEWASLVCTGVTSWNALYGNERLRPGQVVLFQGTGGVSVTGLILAKAAGATTIITSSSEEKLNFVKSKYGADHCINYKTNPNWAEEAKRLTGGRGVDYVIENGGSGTIAQSIDAVAQGGNIAVVGFLSQADQSEMPDVASLVLGKGCVVRGINVGARQLLEEIVQFVSQRGLRMPVHKEFEFSKEQVLEAYRTIQGASHIGKICIKVS